MNSYKEEREGEVKKKEKEKKKTKKLVAVSFNSWRLSFFVFLS